MANTQNLILYLPFDEGQGSAKAYDFSQNRADAEVTGCDFVSGKVGNAIEFPDGVGKADINKDVLANVLNQSWTMMFWINPLSVKVGSPTKIIFMFAYQGVDQYWTQEIPIDPGTWMNVAVVKENNTFRFYVNTQLFATVEHSGSLTGFSVDQDYYGGDQMGLAMVDDLKIFNIAMTYTELSDELSNVRMLEYYLDGVNFKDYGVYVSKSKGLVSRPKMKTPLTENWSNYHGKMIDLNHKFLEERTISLDCFIKTDEGKGGYAVALNNFLRIFDKKGTHRLLCDIHPTHPLVFEVYMEDEIDPDKTWNDNLMVGTFTLKLKEPLPVKRVLKFMKVSSSTSTATITLNSEKVLNVYWGDGSVSKDVSGPVELSHTYEDNGDYFIVIAGVIEEITSFDTNAIVIWQKI